MKGGGGKGGSGKSSVDGTGARGAAARGHGVDGKCAPAGAHAAVTGAAAATAAVAVVGGGGSSAEEKRGGRDEGGGDRVASSSVLSLSSSSSSSVARGSASGRGSTDFVADDFGAFLSEDEESDCVEEEYGDDDDDEDYEEEGEGRGDADFEDSEIIGSQIEKRFMRSLQPDQPQGKPPWADPLPPLEKVRRPPPPGQVLDLTDIGGDEDAGAKNGRWNGPGASAGWDGGGAAAASAAASMDPRFSIEDISDDDNEFAIDLGARGRLNRGVGGNLHGDGESVNGDADGFTASARGMLEHEEPPPPKFRYFASVSEHRDRGSSCVDFASLGAAPTGGASGTRSYEARKRLRDNKASKSKRGKKGRKSRATSSSSARGRGTPARASRGRGGGSGKSSSRGGVGSGRVPSGSWIPAGIVSRLSVPSGSAAGGRSGGGPAGSGAGASVQRQPFNHYRGNDEMVDDSNGGGGLHWEHAGQSSFGD